jgi:hypothetical protein
MKAVSPVISTVFIILLTFVTVSLVLLVGKPAIDRAKEMGVINEAQQNLRMLDNTIREVVYEGVGSFRAVQLKVTDGEYRIFNYSGNFTGAVEYTLDANYNTLPRLSIVREDNIKFSTGVSTRGLVGWWKFDEGSGTAAADSSGNGNNGSLYDANTTNVDGNTPPTWTTGKFGKALSFDGVDDYVLVHDSPSINITGNQMTIEVWINPSIAGQQDKWIVKKMFAGTEGYRLGLVGGKVFLQIPNSTAWSYGLSGTTYLLANTWYHAIGTYDGSTMKIYVNGTLESSMSKTENIIPAADNLWIGTWTSTTAHFNGTIDEVRIYNRALTADEIKASYDAKASDYRAVLEYNTTFIQGSFKFGKGSYKVCIEKTGTLMNKALVSITSC